MQIVNAWLKHLGGTKYQACLKWRDDEFNKTHDKRKMISAASKTEAERKLNKFRDMVVRGDIPVSAPAPKSQITFEEYINNYYLKYLDASNKSPRTKKQFNILFKLYLIPQLGRYRLDDIDRNLIEYEFKPFLLDESKRPGKKKPSLQTCNYLIKRLLTVLRRATKDSKRTTPVPEIDFFPKHHSKPKYEPLSDESINKAIKIAASKGPNHTAFLFLGCDCALRVSEIAGLTWENVKLDKSKTYPFGYVDIVSQRDAFGARETKGVGNTEINVRIPLTERANKALASVPRRNALVIINPITKKPPSYTYFAGMHKRLFGFAATHAMRHYAITRMARKGINIKIIKDLARHSDVQTTFRYIDTTAQDLVAAMLDT